VNYQICKIADDAYSVSPDNGVPRYLQVYCTMNRQGVIAFIGECHGQVDGTDDAKWSEVLSRVEALLGQPKIGFKGTVLLD
jgi:hypothetical protein